MNSKYDTKLRLSLRDLSIYLERVQNDDLREEIKKLRNKIASISMTSSPSESDSIISDLTINDFDRIMSHLGTELRKNY